LAEAAAAAAEAETVAVAVLAHAVSQLEKLHVLLSHRRSP